MKRDLKWRSRSVAIGAGAAAFGAFTLLSAAPQLAEAVYGRLAGPFLASLASRLTGVIPISLAELVIVAFVARQLWGLTRGFVDWRNGDRRLGNAVAGGLLRLGADVGIVVATFYVMWGFHYARPPLEQRLQWNGDAAEVEEIARLAGEMVDAANYEYASLTGSDDDGRPTDAPSVGDIFDQLDEGWSTAAEMLELPASAAFGFADPKAPLASSALDYGLTSGFYFPWTAEANYNPGTPAVSLPQVIAHEMAHQRGFAREDEANFAGFLAAAAASASYPRYSAYVFAQRQLLSALARHDRDRAVALVRRRLGGVQRDIDAADGYWEQFEGRTSRATASMNDAYLRSNRVPDGILSYRRSVALLIAYARSRGGWLVRS